MPMVTYPLNNIEYTAEDAELFHSTRTSGIYAANSFNYSATGVDNTIVIGTGIAWIKNSEFSGKVVAQKQSVSIDLGIPDPIYPRIDSVVIQFNANNNSTDIVIKNGNASSNPLKPEIVRTESVYELHLYHVYRKAGASAISNSDITDLRLNAEYCGIMADSVTKIDTDAIERQVADLIRKLKEDIQNVKEESAFLFTSGGTMTGMTRFIPEDGTTVITSEVFRDLPRTSPTESYMTRNVVAVDGAAMQFYKGPLGSRDENEFTEVNRLTLTEMDTWLDKPLTVDSGGTGAKNAATARTNLEVAQAKPSATYTDCYYRKVDDVTEWYNPPTMLGVEYRTTERFNGLPVYTKLMNCGKMPINSIAEIEHGLVITQVVRSMCFWDSVGAFASCYNDGLGGPVVACNVSRSHIVLSCNVELANRGIKVQVWYTKD